MASTTHRYGRLTAGLAVVVCLLAACGEAQDPESAGPTPSVSPTPSSPATLAPTDRPTPTPSSPATLEPTGRPTSAPTGEWPARVGAAVADLAEHLDLPADDVTVVAYDEVTWPDGAIGCPEPGMAYTQALVPGARLVLEAGGVEYSYHAAGENELVRCDRTPPQPPVDAN